jgi:lipopolysaccharide/colanic/teichoic acid biosynthesis glycosyltransferase
MTKNYTLSNGQSIAQVKKISGVQLFFKRVMDVILTLLFLPVVLIFILLACLAMLFTSKGPIIFTQKRVGLNGRIFTIYKIRTMVHCPEGYINHTIKNDDRITKVGTLLRKLKIDELPQIFNVLIGDMSLIGPRPERVDIVEKFTKESNAYQFRHLIKPGITGWAQVNKPTATPDENLEKLEYDLYYINNYSMKLEFRILAKTVAVVTAMESL